VRDQALRTHVQRVRLRRLREQVRPSDGLDWLLLPEKLDRIGNSYYALVRPQGGATLAADEVDVLLKHVDHVLQVLNQALWILPHHVVHLEDLPVYRLNSAHVIILVVARGRVLGSPHF